MNAIFRVSPAHADDIGAVAAYLKKQAAVPVWLVGTSTGSFSAAGGAIASKGIDGLVLTSTVTRADQEWKIGQSHPDGVASMELSRITVPTLIMSRRYDACALTPAADAPKLSQPAGIGEGSQSKGLRVHRWSSNVFGNAEHDRSATAWLPRMSRRGRAAPGEAEAWALSALRHLRHLTAWLPFHRRSNLTAR